MSKSPVVSSNIEALFIAKFRSSFVAGQTAEGNTESSWCDERCFAWQEIRKIRMANKIHFFNLI